MRVLGLAPDVVRRLEGEQRGGQIGLDEGHCSGVLQQTHHRPIFSIRLPRVRREADTDIEALDLDGVLQRHGYACQRAFQVALLGRPFFGFGEEDLGRAIRLLVGFEGDFAVCAEDIDRVGDILLDVLYEVLDGFAEDGALLRCQGVAVRRWEACNLGSALVLLALAMLCELWGAVNLRGKLELGL